MKKEKGRKIMLLGDIGVGKTSIAHRGAFNSFSNNYKATIGVDLFSIDLVIDGTDHSFVLWDTDGEYGMLMFDSIYIKGASGACIISDLGREQTIQSMHKLADTFEERNPGRPVMRIGNKVDIYKNDTETMSELKKDFDFLTSAMEGDGVFEAFRTIAKSCYERGL